MSFNVALTSPQLTQLRRTRWQADQLISFCDNVYALAARVNGAINLSGGTTSAVIIFDTVTSGSYTNVDEGMTIIVSPTSDIRDARAVRLHVRYLGCGPTYVYVSEFSDPITDNSYIWILYHYDAIDNLSRPYGTSPVTQLQQYDQTFQRMAPVIRGLQTGYANWVNSAGHYDIAFDISDSFAAESGASISSYAFSVVATGSGSASVIAGSPSTATVTYRFTYGEYWLKAVVVDDNGVTSFRHSLIKAHDRTHYLPSLDFDGAEITRDVQQGQSARIIGYGGVSTLINGTMVIIWVDEQYSDPDFSNAAGSLFNNIDLIGWIEAEENMFVTDPTVSGYANVSFEVQGLASRLMRLEGQMLAITYAASPTLWDQINNLTAWRAIIHFLQRHTTALQLGDFALSADDDANTFLFPTIVTNAGRALDNVTGSQGIADEINGQVEFASDGRMYLTRREPFVATDLSHTPIIVATWEGQDFIDQFRWSFNHYQQYGILDADGAAWSGTVNVPVMPAKNRAPGLAQGSGPDQAKLNNQILASTSDIGAAQSELGQRAGTQLALSNSNAVLSVSHPSQFHWLQPSMGQVYIWDLDTTFNIRGWDLNAGTHWMLKSLTVRHDNKTGSRTVDASYVPVITGNSGTNIPIINQGSIAPALPILPPMPAFPDIELPLFPEVGLLPNQVTPTGNLIATDGSSFLCATATRAFWISDFIKLTTPHYVDVTPTDLASFEIKGVAISPFFTKTTVPAYILASDGTNSAVWYTPNAAIGTPAWTKGANVTGIYAKIVATDVDGSIEIYTPDTTGSSTTYDFTVSDQGWVLDPSNLNGGTYVAGVGWQATSIQNPVDHDWYMQLALKKTISSSTVTAYHTNYDVVATTYLAPNFDTIFVAGSSVATRPSGSGTDIDLSWSGSVSSATLLQFYAVSSQDASPAGGTVTLKSIRISSTGGGGAAIQLSTDNGATFGGAISVGASPGDVGGFDIQRAGANQFAAAGGKVYRATTLGGAFSAYYTISGGVEAACIVIPYFNWSGTKQTNATNPDIVVALTGVDGSSRSLLWIEGGATSGTVHDITPVASSSFDNANAVTISYNHHIALFCLVSSVYKLYKTTNKGVAWTLVGTRSAPQYIRGRRNDNSAAVSGSNRGQLYLADGSSGGMYWSSTWDSVNPYVRNMPSVPIVAFDTLW